MVPQKIEVLFGVVRRPNERMSATHDAKIWAGERQRLGCAQTGKLDDTIRSVKRYPVESGSGSVWVTERRRVEEESTFECSTAPLG